MKKNKDIEVSAKETTRQVNGETQAVHTLSIGKKTIGEIIEISSKKYEVHMNDNEVSLASSLDQAYEEIIRQWNLFQ